VVVLEGSNDPNLTSYETGTWTQINNIRNIAAGFTARFQSQEFFFSNAIPYRNYRWRVEATRIIPNRCCMQVAEVGLSCNAERMPFQGGAAYAMSKAALVGLVKGLARDLGPRGITINNVQPGPINTDMNPADGDFAKTLIGLMALPHFGTVSDVAAMVSYLAGPESGFVTGASLTVDGGFSA